MTDADAPIPAPREPGETERAKTEQTQPSSALSRLKARSDIRARILLHDPAEPESAVVVRRFEFDRITDMDPNPSARHDTLPLVSLQRVMKQQCEVDGVVHTVKRRQKSVARVIVLLGSGKTGEQFAKAVVVWPSDLLNLVRIAELDLQL